MKAYANDVCSPATPGERELVVHCVRPFALVRSWYIILLCAVVTVGLRPGTAFQKMVRIRYTPLTDKKTQKCAILSESGGFCTQGTKLPLLG